MKLQHIDIRRLPGIDRGFTVNELDPTINFVTGPNASGKSSLIRALRYLLAGPRAGDPHQLSLTAGFHDGEHHWTVDRNGTHVAWQCDGRPADPPAPPPPDLLDSYLIGVEDLLQVQGASEQALAGHLRRELNGGFDLPALRETLFHSAPRAGHKERRELEQARRSREEVERDQRRIADEERRLPDLDRAIEDARNADQERRALDTTLQLHDTAQALRGLDAQLERFPPDMEHLTGREPARLDELARQRENTRQELAQAEQDRDRAYARLAETGLENERPDETELDRLRARLDELRQQEQALATAARECTDARTAREQAIARLDGHAAAARALPRLDDATLDHARDLARRRQELEDRRTALQARLQGAPENSPEQALQRYERAARLLHDWLALPTPAEPARPVLPTVAGAALGGGIAVYGGVLGPPWLAALGGGVMLLALIPLVFPRVLPAGRRRSADAMARTAQRERLARDFEDLDLDLAPPPGAWDAAGVRTRLEAVEQQRDALRMTRRRFDEAETLRADRDTVDAALQQLDAEQAEFAREAGFDPALAARLDDFLERTRALQQAELTLGQAEARHTEIAGRVRTLTQQLQEALARWPTPDPNGAAPGEASAADLAAALEALRARAVQAAEAERRIAEMDRECRRLQAALAEIDRQEARELADVGLEPDQRETLDRRLEQREDWQALQRQRQEQALRRDDLARQLESRADLLALAGIGDPPGDRESLARQLAETTDRAERLEPLQEERSQIRERIAQTGRKREREQALAAEQTAGEELERRRDEALDAEAGRFLLDDIQDEFRREEEPELLRRAREAFARFTHHQWALRLSEAEDGFVGEDRVQGALRGPGELSTATRMQLLLALRLARVETREATGGAGHWPLLIDEALATTDPERAHVMFRTLQELARDGDRQILYLAASDYEVQLWHQATGEWPHRVDLQALRGLPAEATEPARFALPAAPAIPEPGGKDLASWARELGVPRPDPTGPAEDVHLLHVLFDDPATARDLMQVWRVNRVGPLRSLLDGRIARRALPDEHRRAALAYRSLALEHWLAARRIGRNRTVDRGLLEEARDAGVLTDNALEGVAQRATELEGDPQALLESLQQHPITMASGTEQRLRAGHREQLHEFLRERGVVDERAPLTPEARRQRVLERLPAAADPADIQHLIDHLEHETAD